MITREIIHKKKSPRIEGFTLCNHYYTTWAGVSPTIQGVYLRHWLTSLSSTATKAM